MERMQDRTYVDKYGVRITMDWSLVRSMSEAERQQRRENAQRVFREMYDKYVVRPVLEAQRAGKGGNT